MEHSLLGFKKGLNMFTELQKVKQLEGNTAEIGVYAGGASKLIHSELPGRVHYAYDTFCGIMGADNNIDKHVDGEYSCGLEQVQNNIDMDGVIYKVGMFPETFAESHEKFVFVHSDTDTYLGTKASLEHFGPLVVPGGKILLDDYQWHMCPGVEKAVSEFLEVHGSEFNVHVFDNSYVHDLDDSSINQCLLIKKA